MAVLRDNPLDQVITLLQKGTESKRLSTRSAEAAHYLREADKIVDDHDLPRPWPQLVSYRLAHVLLRHAKSQNDLEEIDQHLAIASEAGCIGPLPRLYRMAVLSRLGKTPKEMKTTVNQLINQIDRYSDNENDREEDIECYGRLTALQNNFFNMLELAMYFTGYPYEGFEGKGLLDLGMRRGSSNGGGPFSGLYCKMEEWRLIGTVDGLSTTAYPGEIALEELESRMERGEVKPPCIAFKISDDYTIHHWNVNLQKKNDSFVWKKVRKNAKFLRFLAAILSPHLPRNRASLLFQLFNADSSTADNTFRQQQKRCAEAIDEGFKESGFQDGSINLSGVFLHDQSVSSSLPELNPKISVLGAVDKFLRFD